MLSIASVDAMKGEYNWRKSRNVIALPELGNRNPGHTRQRSRRIYRQVSISVRWITYLRFKATGRTVTFANSVVAGAPTLQMRSRRGGNP